MDKIDFDVMKEIIDAGDAFNILYCAQDCELSILRCRLKSKISLKESQFLDKKFKENGFQYRRVILPESNNDIITICLEHIVMFEGKTVKKVK